LSPWLQGMHGFWREGPLVVGNPRDFLMVDVPDLVATIVGRSNFLASLLLGLPIGASAVICCFLVKFWRLRRRVCCS